MRTKWMRLGVSDPADILRWAGAQHTRRLDDFRHRVIRGREFVSFRLVPRYRVQIGTCDIVVVAHVKPSRKQLVRRAVAAAFREAARRAIAVCASLRPRPIRPAPLLPSAALYDFAALRVSAPSRG